MPFRSDVANPTPCADVDNQGKGKDHPHIDVSEVVLCYCTTRWFLNLPCIREIVRAVLRDKPIIALLQPVTSPTKGGLTEGEARNQLRSPEYQKKLEELPIADWADAWGKPLLRLPTPSEIEAALFKSPPIVWYNFSDMQESPSHSLSPHPTMALHPLASRHTQWLCRHRSLCFNRVAGFVPPPTHRWVPPHPSPLQPTPSYRNLSHPIPSHPTVFHPIPPHQSNPIPPYPIPPYPIPSHPLLSDPALSYPI